MKLILGVLICMVTLFAGTQATRQDIAAVRRLFNGFFRDFNQGRASGIVSILAPGFQFLLNNNPIVTEGFDVVFDQIISSGVRIKDTEVDLIQLSDNVIITVGHITFVWKDTDERLREKNLWVWEKLDDGEWKLFRLQGNNDRPC